MMGDYRNHKEGESMIEALSQREYAEEIFKSCLCQSSQSYCVFYVSVSSSPYA